MIYIDTSAFVKRYHIEAGSEKVNDIFKSGMNGEITIYISYWVISETINALDKHMRRGEFTDVDMKKILGALFYDVYKGIKEGYLMVSEITPEILRASWDYIINEHISAGDALHIVTALYHGCTDFMAADKKLLKVASKMGLKTINPED